MLRSSTMVRALGLTAAWEWVPEEWVCGVRRETHGARRHYWFFILPTIALHLSWNTVRVEEPTAVTIFDQRGVLRAQIDLLPSDAVYRRLLDDRTWAEGQQTYRVQYVADLGGHCWRVQIYDLAQEPRPPPRHFDSWEDWHTRHRA